MITHSDSCLATTTTIECAYIKDHNEGGILSDKTWSECRQACCSDSKCKSFDYGKSGKWDKKCFISYVNADEVPDKLLPRTDCVPNHLSYNEIGNAINLASHCLERCLVTSNLCARIDGHNEGGKFEDRSWSECRDLCCREPLCKSFDHRTTGGYNCALSYVTRTDVPASYRKVKSCEPGGWTYNELVDVTRRKRSLSIENVTANLKPTQKFGKRLINDRSDSWLKKRRIKRQTDTGKSKEELTTGEDNPKKVRAVECKLDEIGGSADWTQNPLACYGESFKAFKRNNSI